MKDRNTAATVIPVIIRSLKKGSLIKIEGFFKADPYTKDGKCVNQYRLVATKIEQVQKKAQ